MHFGQIYTSLGQYHTRVIQMPNCPDKTAFVANLKGLLRMFIDDLNTTIGIEDDPIP